MFEHLETAPPDPILGLTVAFNEDPNPAKVNLGVGVYKDADGVTPVLATVKEAEKRILDQEKTKDYLPITGAADYSAVVQELLFGAGHEIVASKRAATAHTPGGTAALRVAADFLAAMYPGARVWMSAPTWANHGNIFRAAGVETTTYPYYDAATQGLDFAAMAAALRQTPDGDVVLLHACCHNPTGIDPTAEQWAELAAIRDQAGWLPFFDFAYQGFGEGIEEDAVGLRAFCGTGRELLIASSFSKNFGLYRERVGALTVVGGDADAVGRASSHVKRCIRSNYSNPPAHGAQIVAAILRDAALRARWEVEVKEMRDRINGMRRTFAETLKAQGAARDFSFISRQRGMFSFSGLTPEQVKALRERYAIYVVGDGRINVAGMTPGNVEGLCRAIAEVIA